MNENTRKYYIEKGEELEKASNYEDALSSYMEAFSINKCLENDNPDFFAPGFLEDKIAFLAYRIGDFETAVKFGKKAVKENKVDERIRSNLPFYTDALSFLNDKTLYNNYIKERPKTLGVGLVYFWKNEYGKALGMFRNSLEKMNNIQKAEMNYYSGLCYFLNKETTIDCIKYFSKAVELLPMYREAYIHLFKVLEKFEMWSDLEHYVKFALKHKDEIKCNEKEQDEWTALLFIQATLALFKQEKYFEAYGYAALAIDIPMSEERKKIAENNYELLKNGLWSTLQLE